MTTDRTLEIELRLFANFREAVGQKTTTREFAEPVSVGDVLSSIEEEFEGLNGKLLSQDGLQPQINVLKNGQGVLHLDGLDEELKEGDRLSIFPPVAGG